MNISFYSSFNNAPSTQLNFDLLKSIPGLSYDNSFNVADVVLHMAYDAEPKKIKSENPHALVGVIDPRPGQEEMVAQADFFLANGVEMVNLFVAKNRNYFIYPIYKTVNRRFERKEDGIFRIGYHGNKAHLELMSLNVCPALEELAKTRSVELVCFYNFQNLGRWNWSPKSKHLKVTHIQWTDDGYENALENCDVGIVPNLIPFKPDLSTFDKDLEKRKIAFNSDYQFRFKPTSNNGRILVFSQLAIPVISDLFPSAAETIRHGYSGFLAGMDSESWFAHFLNLAENPEKRRKMGENLRSDFDSFYCKTIKNKELIAFMETIKKAR